MRKTPRRRGNTEYVLAAALPAVIGKGERQCSRAVFLKRVNHAGLELAGYKEPQGTCQAVGEILGEWLGSVPWEVGLPGLIALLAHIRQFVDQPPTARQRQGLHALKAPVYLKLAHISLQLAGVCLSDVLDQNNAHHHAGVRAASDLLTWVVSPAPDPFLLERCRGYLRQILVQDEVSVHLIAADTLEDTR
jgi:hypothetical protein